MENFKLFGGRAGAFCYFLGIFLLLRFAHAREYETEPTKNVNLGPIQQWRSSYFCLKHKAVEGPCAGKEPNKDILTPKGELHVPLQDLKDYCDPQNCADQIRFTVLKCIYLVHKNFVFQNGANITYVNQTIAAGCANQTQDLIIHLESKSSRIKVDQKMYVSVVSALLVFVAIFNM